MHHKHKVDAPSGTALLLGEAAAEGRGIDLADQSVRVRDGHTGARRGGHDRLCDAARRLRRRRAFRASSPAKANWSRCRTAPPTARFSRAAPSQAALWARDKKPGLYSMLDVLGLSQHDHLWRNFS